MTLQSALRKRMGCPHCGNGLTVREAGKQSGLGWNAVFRVIHGKAIAAKATVKLCIWLGIDPRKVELP